MLAVVVLTYRPDPAVLHACLASVAASGDADVVVVVDNGQALARGTVDAAVVEGGGDPTRWDLVTTAENLGFAGGMNVGLRRALDRGAEAVALLNDDTVVEPGWLARLAGHLDDPAVGAVQPKLLLGLPGQVPPGPPLVQSVGMHVRPDGAGVDLGHGLPDGPAYATAGPIDLFTGGAVLLSGAFLRDVGGLDERYFMYYEDIDLGRRGRERGWRYLVEPAAVVHHAWSATARAEPGRHRYWQERNRLWWLFRHGTAWQVARGLLLSALRLAKHPTGPQARAVVHGLAGWRWARADRRAGRSVVAPLDGPLRGVVS